MTKEEKELVKIYASLPQIECKKLCSAECGPIAMTRLEGRRMRAAGHEPPDTLAVLRSPSKTCTLLCSATKTCTAYAIRPLICRLWGLVESMRCPHGCIPERWVPERESRALMARVNAIGGSSAFLDAFF